MGTVAILNATFRGHRRHIAFLVLLGTASAALDGIGIGAMVPLLSFLLGGGGLPGDFITEALRGAFGLFGVPFQFRYLIAFIALLFFARAGVQAVFNWMRGLIIGNFMGGEISNLYGGLLRARWGFILKQKAGYLQNTVLWDAKREATLLDAVLQFVQSGTGFCVYLLVALSISPLITLVTVAAGGVMLLMLRPLVRLSVKFAEETSNAEKNISHYLIEQAEGFKAVKSAQAALPVLAQARVQIDRLKRAYASGILVQTAGATLIQPFGFLFIIGLFMVLYKMPDFSLASVAAILYLMQKIFTYLQSTQSSLHGIAEFVPFAANILRFKGDLSDEAETDAGTKPFLFKHSLSFRDVSLAYEPGKDTLSGVSFEIVKGEMVGIVGPSGAGKTSVADLILRLFEPTAGSLLLDGTPAQEISITKWRSGVVYVPQQSFLFNGTIAENIRFYRDNISKENLIEAARAANILSFIETLPEGFETLVGDRGVMLSGGQRQRVALARALAGAPEVLVLDEATSALDGESERLIQEAISSLHGKTTIIVIAHRLSTLSGADTIFVLEQGRIIEQGSPAQLRADPNSYLSRHGA